jgi:glycosyltransferase involved in cell wall biosynthesis
MRIGLVVPGFSAEPRDWCIPALRDLVDRLSEADDVRVITLRYPYRAARYQIGKAEVIALGGAQRRGLQSAWVWQAGFSTLLAEHRRRPFDVLHAFWATESGLLAALAGRVLGRPTLVSLAGGELVGLRDIGYGDQLARAQRLKVSASLRLATAITAGSRHQLGLAERHLAGRHERRLEPERHFSGGYRRRLEWAPLGVDVRLFRAARPLAEKDEPLAKTTGLLAKTTEPLAKTTGLLAKTTEPLAKADERLARPTERPAETHEQLAETTEAWAKTTEPVAKPSAKTAEPRLVHVGALTPVKDQMTLLRAFAELRQSIPAATLEIVGGGPLRDLLERSARALGVAEGVTFRGDVAHDELPTVYAAASVFVLSSRHEAQGMVALEAGACCRPVVGTRVGVLPELEPEAGITVPVRDAHALAEALAAVLGDSARRQKLGAAARALVEKDFSLDGCVERFRQIYVRLLASG